VAKFLVMQFRKLGDVLLATPAIRALKEARPDDELHVLVEKPYAPLLADNARVDRVIVVSSRSGVGETWRVLRTLRRERYEAAIDMKQSSRSTTLTFLSGARERISWDHGFRRRFYNRRIAWGDGFTYMARQKTNLLAPLGVRTDDLTLEFPVGEADREEAAKFLDGCGLGAEGGGLFAAFSPASAFPSRCWPAERYAALVDRLAESHGLRTLVLWGPGERPAAEAVRAGVSRDGAAVVPEIFSSFRTLRALLERAELFVGANSGPLHVAVSAGTPALGIFDYLPPAQWLPLGGPVPCAGASPDHEALVKLGPKTPWEEYIRAVTVEAAVAKAEGLLAARRKPKAEA